MISTYNVYNVKANEKKLRSSKNISCIRYLNEVPIGFYTVILI